MNERIYWRGCYSSGRGDELFSAQSNRHPAKMSGALLDRIRRFGEEKGWWSPGDRIVDNFYGIGTTGLLTLHGYDVLGIELEESFFKMACENAEILEKKGTWLKSKGRCRIIQGDSRKLAELLGIEIDGGLTSPPYTNLRKGGGLNIEPPETFRGVLRDHSLKEGDSEGQIGNLPDRPDAALTSPPYTGVPDWHRETLRPRNQQAFFCKGYADASVTSPPYLQSQEGRGIVKQGYLDTGDQVADRCGYTAERQGRSEGQISQLPDAALLSPPYAGQNQRDIAREEYGSQVIGGLKRNIRQTQPYGETGGQIGALPDQPDAAVLSPPWGDQRCYQIYDEEKGFHSYDENESKSRMKRDYMPGEGEGQIGGLPDGAVLSPPYAGSTGHSRGSAGPPRRSDGSLVDDALHRSDGYGESEGQIERLPDRLDAAVLSPPYADSVSGGRRSGIDWDKAGRPDRLEESAHRHNVQGCHEWHYGEEEGQIGNLADAGVTSPPYEDAQNITVPGSFTEGRKAMREAQRDRSKGPGGVGPAYIAPESEGQIGRERGETYQDAMLLCYQQLRECLKPGGVACVVTKNPTREGQLRRLDLDTSWLLLQAGFQLWCPLCEGWTSEIHLHPDDQLEPVVGYRAILAEEVEQPSLFGETEVSLKGRVSFFKRLHYEKGLPIAMWEDILFARKPSPRASSEDQKNC